MFVIALLFCVEVHTLQGVHTTNEQIAVCSGKKGTVGRWVTQERLKRLPSVSVQDCCTSHRMKQSAV